MGINTGALYIIFIMLAITGFAYITSGPTPSQIPVLTGPEVALTTGKTGKAQANLQLYNFNGATITPPTTSLCTKGGANVHPEALVAYSPDQSTAISNTGEIKLWVSDSKQPYISPGELITRSNGAVKAAGDRTATAPDTYKIEPQLYVFPYTVEKNGQAYYPDFVKGDYNNGTAATPATGVSYGGDVLPISALPTSNFTVEFVWKVANIGLTDGDYNIEFVAHDGHLNLGIRCMTLRIYTPSAAQTQGNQLPL
jgi:hypothetical protein